MTRAAIGIIEIMIDDRVSEFVKNCLRVVEHDR